MPRPGPVGPDACGEASVLSASLVVLILVTGLIQPSYLSFSGMRNTLLLAAPLAIMAAGQTSLLLTGASTSRWRWSPPAPLYVAGNQSPNGAAIAIVLGLMVGVLAGFVNGIGVGVFRVNPLIMTLAMSAILLGLFTWLAQTVLTGSTSVAPFIETVGGGSFFGNRIPWSVLVWAAVALLILWISIAPVWTGHLCRW